MIRPAIALFVILAALAPPSEAAASGGEPVQKPAPPAAEAAAPDDLPPPPGSAADVALWRSGNATLVAITAERSRAGLLQARLRSNKVLERLEEAAARAGPREKESLLALRTRLVDAWQADYQLMARQWPVDPTRGCGYPTMAFESALRANPGTDRGELAQARGALSECVAKADSVVKPLAEATRVLEGVAAEADQALRPPAKEAAGKVTK